MKKICLGLLATLCILTLAGCAGPVIRGNQEGYLGDAETLDRTPAPVPIYFLQVGDEITVKFFYNHDLDEDLVVRPDGKISLQLIHDVEAMGKTPEHLSWEIMEKYKKILNKPEVTVIVKRFAGQRIYVGWEVRQPGLLSIDSQMTALQALLQTGGFLNTASVRDVLLIRRGGDGRPKIYKHDLEDPANDVYLTGCDIVFVPRSNIASMNLFVEQYIDKLIPISRSIGFTYVTDLYVP